MTWHPGHPLLSRLHCLCLGFALQWKRHTTHLAFPSRIYTRRRVQFSFVSHSSAWETEWDASEWASADLWVRWWGSTMCSGIQSMGPCVFECPWGCHSLLSMACSILATVMMLVTFLLVIITQRPDLTPRFKENKVVMWWWVFDFQKMAQCSFFNHSCRGNHSCYIMHCRKTQLLSRARFAILIAWARSCVFWPAFFSWWWHGECQGQASSWKREAIDVDSARSRQNEMRNEYYGFIKFV